MRLIFLFKRLCGVKPKVFDEMVDILKQESPKQRQRGGQAKLTAEDQLLIAFRIDLLHESCKRSCIFLNV